jgi:hypothetical protein
MNNDRLQRRRRNAPEERPISEDLIDDYARRSQFVVAEFLEELGAT